MKIKRLFGVLIGCFLLSGSLLVSASHFQYFVSIQNEGTKKYKALRLPAEIVSSCQTNLADVQLQNSTGETIPYFLHQWKEIQDVIKKSYNMKLTYSFVKDSWQFFDFALVSPIDGDMQASSITITTNHTNYVKKVEVLGSYDGVHWSLVQKDLLYAVDGYFKPTISFDSVQKYTYYRLQVPYAGESINFTSAKLHFDQDLVQKEYFIETVEPRFTTEEIGTTTVITLYDMKNIALSDITIVTDDIFQRVFQYQYLSPVELYNLRFTDQNYQYLTVPMDGWTELQPEGKLIIENFNDRPITIQKIKVRRFVQELVFDEGDANSFTLLFGNPTITEKPQYDIGKYRESILQEGYDVLSLGTIQEETSSPAQTKNHQQIFNLIILGIVILIGGLLLFKLKKHSEKKD